MNAFVLLSRLIYGFLYSHAPAGFYQPDLFYSDLRCLLTFVVKRGNGQIS